MGKLFNVSSSPHVRSKHTTQGYRYASGKYLWCMDVWNARITGSDCNRIILRNFRVCFWETDEKTDYHF